MIWMNIPGQPGFKASFDGRIMDLRQSEPVVLDPTPDTAGYLWVQLDGPRRVDELIALTYLGEPPLGLTPHHKDDNRGNNHLGNLCYAVPSTPRQGHHEALRTHCDAGHEYTPPNTMWRWGKGGKAGGIKYRKCRQCHNQSVTRYRTATRTSGSRPPAD